MKIELPKIIDLKPIDKIAIQAHECHVKWRPDILLPTTYTNGNISEKIKNVNIVLNRSKLAIDESKIKRLNIRNLN